MKSVAGSKFQSLEVIRINDLAKALVRLHFDSECVLDIQKPRVSYKEGLLILARLSLNKYRSSM